MTNGAEDPPKVDRRSLRWDKHRTERREKLLDTTMNAVRKYGEGVSMDQIAEEARTSKSIVYRYFEDKSGLQLALGERIVAELMDDIRSATSATASSRDMFRASVQTFINFLVTDPEIYFFLRVGELEGDPEAPFLLNFDFVIDAVVRSEFGEDAVFFEHPMRQAYERLFSASASNLVRGSAEEWLRARRIVFDRAESSTCTPDQAQRQLAQLSESDIVGILSETLNVMFESVIGILENWDSSQTV